MRFPSKVARFVTGTGALAMLAGCSGAGGGMTPPATIAAASVARQGAGRDCASTRPLTNPYGNWIRGGAFRAIGEPASIASTQFSKERSAIAVADARNSVVDIFGPTGALVKQLTGFAGPDGLASDIRGDLFVADTYNSRIEAFRAGFNRAPAILAEPGQLPSGVDSFNNGEIVASANFSVPCGNSGSVSFFVDGALTKTITSASLASAYFCAFDAVGNLYVTGIDYNSQPIVGEITRGAKGTIFTPLTTSNSFGSAVGIQVTTDGKIAIADQAGGIYTYNPPVSGSLGSPIATTPLTGDSDPITFAFTKKMTNLFASDYGSGTFDGFGYPAGGTMVSSIGMSGSPVGVAVIPTQFPKK